MKRSKEGNEGQKDRRIEGMKGYKGRRYKGRRIKGQTNRSKEGNEGQNRKDLERYIYIYMKDERIERKERKSKEITGFVTIHMFNID